MAMLRVILRDDVQNLGEAGEVVSVKPGYARNYLLPRGLALIATEARVREFEHQRRAIAERQAKQLKQHESVKRAIEKLALRIEVQAGEQGRLFGSVTAAQVAELLAEQGFEVDRRKLAMPEPIKTVGEHTLTLKLHRELVAQVKLSVVAAAADAAAATGHPLTAAPRSAEQLPEGAAADAAADNAGDAAATDAAATVEGASEDESEAADEA